jgi:hypothetical protein
MARMSAAQPDNGAGAGCQASTQLDPVVLKARSAEERLIDKPVGPDIIILTMFSGNFAPG